MNLALPALVILLGLLPGIACFVKHENPMAWFFAMLGGLIALEIGLHVAIAIQ